MSDPFFDEPAFLEDLATLVGFRTVVCSNRAEFVRSSRWIRDFFDPALTEFIDFDCHGLTTTIVKHLGSKRPGMIGAGHIEVVPGSDDQHALRREGDRLYGRGVADMKTQVLAMMHTLRRMIAEGDHRNFWLVLSQDEEVGSEAGATVVVDHLVAKDLLPPVVFAPDGGPDFAYVEKEK